MDFITVKCVVIVNLYIVNIRLLRELYLVVRIAWLVGGLENGVRFLADLLLVGFLRLL